MMKRATMQWVTVGMLLALSFPGFALEAGVASVDVTPDEPVPVTGGLGTPEPTTEIKGRLEIRALVLSEGDTTIAIASVPFIGFPQVLIDRVRDGVTGIPGENIMVGATHTHSAPDMYAFLDEEGKCTADLDYVDRVCKATADAINQAAESLSPVSLKIATGEAAERIAYNYYAPELYDRRCDVIQALDSDGNAVATLVNYAIHPEVLGPDRGILSPDMIGPLYDRVEALGGGMCVFMNGAQGGMVTADCRVPDGDGREQYNTWEECIRIGNLLAEEALRIVSEAPVQESPSLTCEASDLTLLVENPMFRQIIQSSPLEYEISDDFTVTTQLNVVNVGSAQILTIPGEAMPNIGFYLKRKMHGTTNMLFGLTNDAFGYMLTKEDFDSFRRYDYITRTSMGEQVAEMYIEAALKAVDAAPRPDKLSGD
jgi:hypothetical protein